LSFFLGGQGAKAYVVIVKNKEAFKRLELGSHNQKLAEYKRLIGCLPGASVPVAAQPMTSSEATIDLTED
jgi:hypothetical protein